jgi:hypothetical protein
LSKLFYEQFFDRRLFVPDGNGAPMELDANHLTVEGSIYFIRANERALLNH